jgi:hypothetical protein
MKTEQWKFKVTTGHPEYFVSNVIPTIEELEGQADLTSDILGEQQYWVTLPTSVISSQLDVLIEMDRYSTWVIQSRRAFYELEDLSK